MGLLPGVIVPVFIEFTVTVILYDTDFMKKGKIAWENSIKTVYDIYSCCTSIYAIFMASLKHGAFTWSYRSSIYRVHCYGDTLRYRLYEKGENSLGK